MFRNPPQKNKVVKYPDLAKHLKDLRKVNNLSQQELCNLTGIALGTLALLECGNYLMNWEVAQSLSKYENNNLTLDEYFLKGFVSIPRGCFNKRRKKVSG